jgi:hypothetical protein
LDVEYVTGIADEALIPPKHTIPNLAAQSDVMSEGTQQILAGLGMKPVITRSSLHANRSFRKVFKGQWNTLYHFQRSNIK